MDTPTTEAIAAIRARIDAVAGWRREADSLAAQADDLERRAVIADQAAALLRSISSDRASDLAARVSDLVTRGLRTVFEDDAVEFRVTTRTLRGQSAVEFALVTDGVERPVLDHHGGGVAEVVAFVLRVVVVLLTPGTRRVLILDEPFARVSVDYRPRLASFVRDLVESTGLQLIVVTHDDALPEVADVHYRVSRRGGESSFQLVPPSSWTPRTST